MDTKIKKKWNYIIGTILFIVSWAILYHQFFVKRDMSSIYTSYKSFKICNFDYLLFVLLFVLMLVNLFIESYKWKLLVDKTEKLNIIECFKIILAGLAASLFLPWHTGDLFSKVVSTKENSKSNSLGLASLSSFSQLFWTVFFGLVAICFIYINKEMFILNPNYLFIIIIVSLLLIFFLFAVIFLPSFNKYQNICKVKNNRIEHFLQSFTQTSIKLKSSIFILSLLRYLVFCLQYLVCFIIFDVNISWIYVFVFSSLLFLLTSVIPSYLISDLSVRGSIAVFLITNIFIIQNISNDPAIISVVVVSVIWIVNRLIPSLIGSFYLRKMNYLTMFAKK